MKQEQRLLRRWTFNLANELIDEGWDRKDGTVRRAHGTLCKGISKEFDHYEYKTEHQKKNPLGVFTYYDLDATGFRTFHATKLVRIIETVIKSKSL